MKNIIQFIVFILGLLWVISFYVWAIWYVISSNYKPKMLALPVLILGGAGIVYYWGKEVKEQFLRVRQFLTMRSLAKTGKPVIPQSLQTKQAMGIQMIKGKYFLMEQFPLVFTFSFLVLSSMISLFPPFYWGEDMIQYRIQKLNISIPDAVELGAETDRDWMEIKVNKELPILQAELPIRQHSLLFGDSKKWFDIPTPPEKFSTPLRYKLNRRLIISETLLFYVLAFALSGVLQLLFMLKRKS